MVKIEYLERSHMNPRDNVFAQGGRRVCWAADGSSVCAPTLGDTDESLSSPCKQRAPVHSKHSQAVHGPLLFGQEILR